MADDFRNVNYTASGAQAIADSFANQVAYCRANGAPITGRICAALLDLLRGEEGGAVMERIRFWPGSPLADALPLRIAGGLHALHLSGREPALAPVYSGEAEADVEGIIADALHRHEGELLPWLDGPPQTNEAGRSASFVAGMLWLAGQGLPPRFECLEIGSSAGINLMLPSYHYDLGGVEVGPKLAAMQIAPRWIGNPPPAGDIAFAALRGCDVAPVDLTDPAEALRLRAYIWPEATERFARMDAAIEAARAHKPDVAAMNAADFVEAELGRPQEQGTTRVLMHSIVWQYVPADQQARVAAAMEAAGRRATPQRALAWIALEANRAELKHELVVRFWPGTGEPRMLARAHAHGAEIEWL